MRGLLAVGTILFASLAAATSQTITFNALTGKTFGAVPFTVSATASSGLTVTFSSLTTPVCTVSTATVTIVAAGTCTIQASQAGNGTYSAAPNVNQSFTVAKAAQTVNFAALTGKTYGAVPFAVSATASSGLAVAFASTTTSVCTVSTATVTIIAGGTCTIQASQAGNGNYNAATNVNQSFTVAKAAQTISFGALTGKTFGAAPFTVSATASSGLTVTFTSTTTSICTVSTATVTIVTGGTCTIRAAQAGNGNYLAATNVDQSFTVAKANQTITFGGLTGQTYGVAPFTVSATASSGLAITFTSTTTTICTVSGSTVTIKAVGTCTIQAAQAGNTSYNAATSVSQSFAVAKANQTITFGALGNQTYGVAPFAVSATASSSLAVTITSTTTPVCTISGSTVTVRAVGLCTLQAAQAGNANYNAATNVSQSFTVAQATQSITFNALANKTLGSSPFTVSATASSGLAVTFSSTTTSTCTVSGTTVTLVAAGTCTVQAAQAGNSNYTAAPNVPQSFTIAAGSQTISFPQPGNVLTNASPLALSATASSGLAVTFVSQTTPVCTVSGSAAILLAGGICTIQAQQAGNANYGAAPTVNRSFTVITVPQFGAPTTYTTGGFSDDIAIADFNGDGKPDIAVANFFGQNVSILIGNGAGTFTPGMAVELTGAPMAFGAGDFDGDGKIDLAVAEPGSDAVEILKNNGDGTFTLLPPVFVGLAPFSIAVADFNGDGKLDLAVSLGSYGDNTGQLVSIVFGNGDGTFGAPQAYLVGSSPYQVVTADFNGDGKPDLAVVSYDDDVVSVLLNNGDGTFAAAVDYGTAFGPIALAVGDFNGDGHSDLAAGSDGSQVSILLGQAGGTFGTATDFLTGNGSASVSVADLNGDGILDLAVINQFDNTLTLLLGNGDGTFQPPIAYPIDPQPESVVARDLNGDGRPDLVMTSAANGTISVMLQGGAIPATLTVQAGSPQSAAVNAAYATPLAVLVKDAGGSPAPGVAITFTAPSSGASGAFAGSGRVAYAASNASGIATAPTFTANSLSGSFAVVASVGALNATFSLTNTGGGGQAPLFTSGSAPGGTISVPYNYTLAASGSPAPTFSVTPGALPPGLALTPASGLLNGTPATTGTYAGMFTAANGTTPDATQSFAITIAGMAQTITFGALPPKMLGDAPFAVSATASSGLTVTFSSTTTSVCTMSGTTVTLVTVGTCNIRAAQAGNATYAPAPNVNQSFTISSLLSQTISFGALGNQLITAAPFGVSATASSGLAVSFASLTTGVCTVSGSTVTLVAAGSCTIQASQAGNGTYAPAPSISQGFIVSLVSQTITFGALGSQFVVAAPFAVSATASSGLTVTFSSLTTSVCTVAGNTVTLVAVGACTIRAAQAGNATYAAAPNVDQSFTVMADQLPTVALALPLTGSVYVAPATVPLWATASDADGSISKVEFYNGAALLGTATTAPFTFTWTSVAAGTYVLTAKAYDNVGGTTTSANANITVNATGSSAPFMHSANYPIAHPTGIALADLNHDGHLDVVANPGPGVLLGSGLGTFQNALSSTYAGGQIASGDFNGDGVIDIVGSVGGAVQMSLGNGDGTFHPVVSYPAGSGGNIVVGDINGDGKLDVLTTNYYDGTISVLLGNGDGTLRPVTTIAAGTFPAGIVLGDFNGDGKLDVAVSNQTGNSGTTTVSIFLGNGDGTFGTRVTYLTGTGASSVAVGDFNNDGKLDLAVTGLSTTVAILLGNGNGTFQPAFQYPTGYAAFGVVVADFDGDGKLDVAVPNSNNNAVSVLLGNGNGSLRAPVAYTVGVGPIALAAGDLDGDGKPDLVVANGGVGANSFSVLINTTGRTLQAPAFTSGPMPDGVAGTPYSFTFTASGIPAPQFLLSNASSNFVTLNGSGLLTVTANAGSGTYTGTVVAHNGVTPDATQNFAFVIRAAQATVTFPQPTDMLLCSTCLGQSFLVGTSLPVWPSVESLTPEICSITTSPTGLQTGVTITTVAVGTCTLRATVSGGPTVDRSLQVFAHSTPLVLLTSPADGAGFVAPALVTLTATVVASPAGATISQVDFLHDGVFIGSTTSSPYTYAWTGVPVGHYAVTALAHESYFSGGVQVQVTQSSPAVTAVVTATPDQPVVAFTAPAPNATFSLPAVISLTANATNATGTIAKVDFYKGEFLLGTVTAPPYTFVWNVQQPGSYTITVKATSGNGVVATTTPLSVLVDSGTPVFLAHYAFDDAWTTYGVIHGAGYGTIDGDPRGSVAPITAPAIAPKPDTCKALDFSGGTVDVGDLQVATQTGAKTTVAFWMHWNGADGAMPLSWATQGLIFSGGSFGFTTLSGDVFGVSSTGLSNTWHYVVAEFNNGSVTGNRLYIDNTLQSPTQRTGTPNVTNAIVSGTLRMGGQYGATTNRFVGQFDELWIFSSILSPAYVSSLYTAANPCAPVTITIVAPGNNAVYDAPQTVDFTVVATSQNGVITFYDYYDNGTLLARNPSVANFTLAPGTHTLTVKATDSTGANATSSPVTVTIVTITGSSTVATVTPAQGGTFYTSGTVHIGATAIPAPGYNVARVEFYANGQEIGWSTTAPYDFTWRLPTPGTYTITVNVIDDAGYVTTSAPITITVVAGAPAVTYYYNDVAGTPVAASDQNGNLLWDETYAPYGDRYSHEDTGTQNGIWYTGKPVEDSTGLSYLGARWYNPSLGRFYGADPIRFQEGKPLSFNRYAYGNNNPYGFSDPDGRDSTGLLESPSNADLGLGSGGRPWNGVGPPPAIAQAQDNLAKTVDRAASSAIDKLSYIFKSDSVTLARNMARESVDTRESGQHAHHIVAANAKIAEPARQVLNAVGMDINSAFNGVFLDPAYHQSLHTVAYYQNVNLMLFGLKSYTEVAAQLTVIRGMLNTNTFPH